MTWPRLSALLLGGELSLDGRPDRVGSRWHIYVYDSAIERQGIDNRVDNRRRCPDGAGFTGSLEAHRICRARHVTHADIEIWQIFGARQSVIHQ